MGKIIGVRRQKVEKLKKRLKIKINIAFLSYPWNDFDVGQGSWIEAHNMS